MLFNFGGMEEVQSKAQRVIESILSDKSYLNPQKFELVLRDYEKRQSKLDAEVSVSIKNQIENINHAKKQIEQGNKSMVQSKERIDNLNRIYSRQTKFHQTFLQISKIYTYQKNIATVIDQLKSFINLEGEIAEIRSLLTDESNYEIINEKILNLIDLRENVMKKLQIQKSKDISLIKKEFEQVQLLQREFYKSVFEKFKHCIKLGKTNPTTLVMLAKIIERGDQILESRGKETYMRQKAVSTIKQSIDEKFQQKIGSLDSVVQIIQNSQFVTEDLIDVLDFVVKCFPGRYKIFQIFQNRYQLNIEKYVMPRFQTIAEEKEYGNLLVLLTWIQDYESILQRAGVTTDSYVVMKSKVKQIMPYFIQHNQKLIAEFIENCMVLDSKNYNMKFYEQLIRSKTDFVSNYPSDIFTFINKEAEVIKEQVRGELFIQFVRCIASELGAAQLALRNSIEEDYKMIELTNNSDKIVEFEYLVILHLNNFSECLNHASEAKDEYTDIVAEQYRDRVRKIFLTEVQKKFNESVSALVNLVTGIIFLDLRRQEFTQLFTQKWAQGSKRDTISLILNTVNQESKDVQVIINNPINYRMLVKTNYQYYCNLYAEMLIYTIKNQYGLNFAWTPKHINPTYMDRVFKKSAFKLTKTILSECISKDNIVALKNAEEMNQYLNKDYITRIQTKLNVLKECFSRSKSDFQKLLQPLAQNFQGNCMAILEVTLCVREEIDKSLLAKLQEIIQKKTKK